MRFFPALVFSLVIALPVLAAASLPRSTPEARGVSSAASLGCVESAEEKINALHSVMIVRRGHVVAEGWWAPYAAERPHRMFSLFRETK